MFSVTREMNINPQMCFPLVQKAYNCINFSMCTFLMSNANQVFAEMWKLRVEMHLFSQVKNVFHSINLQKTNSPQLH